MSGEALYERYKDALKRGHVASMRGQLEQALTAYAEAASIAPERATPHTSAGTALMRARRPADALRHYTRAIALAPRDEAALLGRAQALAALDRRPEAADAFDTLADVQAGGGRLADAVDAARHGLELAEGRERRRTLERLISRLRESEPGEPGRAALDRALHILEGAAVSQQAPGSAATPAPDGAAVADGGEASPGVPAIVRRALDRDLPDDVDPITLEAAATAAIDGAAADDAVERLLDLATLYRRAGQADAAIDACYRGLSMDPDSIGLHLALIELYDDRGWTRLAGDKLDLLDRLAALDEDIPVAERLATARAARG